MWAPCLSRRLRCHKGNTRRSATSTAPRSNLVVLFLGLQTCVCVCPALSQRVTPLTCHSNFKQGGKASSDEPCPTKLSRWRGSEWRRPFVYLQPKLLTTLSNLIGLIHGPSCYLPLKPFSLRHFQQPRGFYSLSLQLCAKHLLKHLQLFGPFTVPFPHHFSWKLS